MSTADTEAVAMAIVGSFFLLLGALAYRLRLRTGQRNQWLYVGPATALVAFGVMIANLRGLVFSGV